MSMRKIQGHSNSEWQAIFDHVKGQYYVKQLII